MPGSAELALRRWWWRRRGAVDEALTGCWGVTSPSARSPVEAIRFLVCDGEMSGLDARQAELLSLGWVPVEQGEIVLGAAVQLLLQPRGGVGQSAVVHGLRDCELSDARALDDGLRQFLKAAEGAVLVFHHAPLDLAFLDRACRQAFGAPLLLPTVDTLALERRRLARRNQTLEQGALSLGGCRARYGLPPHRAHDALADAVATAELLLAQLATAGPGLRLGDLC